MSFAVDSNVRVIDQNSAYRNQNGVVQSVAGDPALYQVRLTGHGCSQRVAFYEEQLGTELRTMPLQYTYCAN